MKIYLENLKYKLYTLPPVPFPAINKWLWPLSLNCVFNKDPQICFCEVFFNYLYISLHCKYYQSLFVVWPVCAVSPPHRHPLLWHCWRIWWVSRAVVTELLLPKRSQIVFFWVFSAASGSVCNVRAVNNNGIPWILHRSPSVMNRNTPYSPQIKVVLCARMPLSFSWYLVVVST